MDNSTYFEDIIESITDYEKIELLMFLIQNEKNLLLEIGLSERDVNRLNLEFKTVSIEQLEECLEYVKNQEESIIERFSNK